MEHLQYGTKQFSIKQYGRYLSGEETPSRVQQLLLGQSRIRAVKKGKVKSSWVTQMPPLYIPNKANKFKIKNNLGNEITSQTVLINGEHKRVRIRHKDEVVVSNQLWKEILNELSK